MADITVTAADVRPLPGAKTRRFTAGETITPGQPVYLSASDTVSLADGSSVSTSFAIGIVVGGQDGQTSFAAGEKVDVCYDGPVAGFATNLAYNTLAYVDDDAGIMATTTGTKTTIVGIGLSTAVLLVKPQWVSLS